MTLVTQLASSPAWAASAPQTPVITEPAVNGQVVSGADVHMETAPFQDADGDLHRCTDWAIWAADAAERVWSASCIGVLPQTIHVHLGDGAFEGSLAGRTALLPDTGYELRVRHRDDSGDSAAEWSAYATRVFRTDVERQPLPDAPEWTVEPGYVVEEIASGFQLPVNVVPVPSYGSNVSSPMLYVAELYGRIKVIKGDATVGTYASGLLNFDPTGQFPGSGEQGLTGLVVEPVTGDLFAAMLYESGGAHHPKVVRFHSNDGGLTAATQTTVLDMPAESQSASHQISNLTIGPDGKLYVHVGDGFTASRASNLESFQGKILRVNLDGTAPTDNPFYDSAAITARDYVFAYGFRNPFGGAWRAANNTHYEVENGPSVDRLAKVSRGVNYGWDGTDASIRTNALYVWDPSHAPVNIDFVEPNRFHASGFPEDKQGHAFVSESGPTYATGPQSRGKRIIEFAFNADGSVAPPQTLVEYTGTGKSSVAGLASGPRGLYFTSLYSDDPAAGPTGSQAKVFRVRHDPPAPGSVPVSVYEHRDFAGRRQDLGAGMHDSSAGELSQVGNDSVSSLRVSPGYHAAVCEHDSAGRTTVESLGLCRYYGPGLYSYVGTDLNDRASLVSVLTSPAGGSAAVAYTEPAFGGKSQSMGIGEYESDNSISSLRVLGAHRVVMCANNSGNLGQCGYFSSGNYPSLGAGLDNQVSLVAVGESFVTVYQHRDFAGTAQALRPGRYEAVNGELDQVGNDSISSLRVPAPYRLVVCTHDSLGRTNTGNLGYCRFYGPGNHAFVGAELNDVISLISAQTGPSSGNALTAYRNRNFGGTSSSFGVGHFEAASQELGPVGNNAITSLKVAAGQGSVVCEHDSVGRTNTGSLGLCRFYGPGNHAHVGQDLNDKISLVTVSP